MHNDNFQLQYIVLPVETGLFIRSGFTLNVFIWEFLAIVNHLVQNFWKYERNHSGNGFLHL